MTSQDAHMFRVSAGFPSPADDFLERRLDVTELLISHPPTTYFARVSGTSMQGAGIHDGDILVIDRSLAAEHGAIILALLNGGFTVKRPSIQPDGIALVSEHGVREPETIRITDQMPCEIWGVVTACIHLFR